MKLLIYAINGRGMGHLNRTLVLAKAIQKVDPGVQIQFVVRSPLFGIAADSGFETIKIPDNHHDLGRYALRSARQAQTSELFGAILQWSRPDHLLIDFVVEPKLFSTAKAHGAQLSLVLRAQRSSEMLSLAKKPCMRKVDRFLLPHDQAELPLKSLPSAWQERSTHLGPLVRTLDGKATTAVRRRYANDSERLVVVAIGGGGFKESYRTLEIAEQAALALSHRDVNPVHWVLVYGPFYPETVPASEGQVTRLRYEANLLELFAASDVIVCNAGYNTISEVMVCGTPAVVIPLKSTGRDDQHERAERAEQEGRAVLCEEDAPQLADKVQTLLRGELVRRRAPETSSASDETGKRALAALKARPTRL